MCYEIITPVIVLIAFIVLIVNLINYKKIKKSLFWISLILLLFVIYQGVPYYFEMSAVLSKNSDNFIQNYKKAINASILPAQKGMMYAILAGGVQAENLPLSIQYYDEAHKYIKKYDSRMLWTMATLAYYMNGDFDKTIEISNGINAFAMASNAYVMKNDYKNALECINKEIEKKPSSWSFLASRANIYCNLGKYKEAQADYIKAMSLCDNQRGINQIKAKYNNKNFVKDDWTRMRAYAQSKGFIL